MNRRPLLRRRWLLCLATLSAFAIPGVSHAQPPTWGKAFAPSTIGPGSVSSLTFTITNPDTVNPVGNLAFTDVLPAGMTIADPASAFTDCTNAILSAPDGGTTISFTNGQLGAGASCTVRVNVIATITGLNVSGTLTSDAGSSGTAAATLTVDTGRPGFSKSFAPSSIPLGGISTLTFTIDNSANAGVETFLGFNDPLPAGVVVAPAPNATSDCGTPPFTVPSITANPGSSSISVNVLGSVPFPAVGAMTTCTVSVNVTATANGSFDNISSDLELSGAALSGFSTDTLDVPREFLNKSFTDDPASPGGTVTLEFTVQNPDRTSSATGLTFSDDLDSVISGLAPSGALPMNPCGAGSSLSFVAGTLTLTGGSLPAEGSCTFSVSLLVPAGASSGAFGNTTTAVMATIGGSPVVGNTASDVLFVSTAPLLTKQFTDDPVGTGGTVNLRFTMTNVSSATSATNVAFTDNLTAVLDGLTPTGLPFVDPCSGATVSSFVSVDDLFLNISGGTLAPAGMAGDSCTIDISLSVPIGAPAGTFPNTTSVITATVDGGPQSGQSGSDSLVVVAPPLLTKEFTDDPVAPGGTVTLQFTLEHDAGAPTDATAIAFTDDLAAALPGLTATLPPTPDPPCGAGSSLTGSAGDTFLTFAGGTLMPGQTCIFSVVLTVPAGATPGPKINTTSDVTATQGGVAATGSPAADSLLVAGLTLSKEFIDDPTVPGDTVTLRFTLDNTSGTADATAISFSDSLSAALPGLAATGLPVAGCGGTATTANGGLTVDFTAGSVLAGASCFFDVSVTVPGAASDGSYLNVTTPLSATLGVTPATLDPATDALEVSSELLSITKSFTDDPAIPGGTVTLELTIQNLDPSGMATAIAFSDDLDAALSGLTATAAPVNTCGGMGPGFPTGNFTYSGGSLAGGASCTVTLTLSVPAGPLPGNTFTNTTSDVTGTINGFAVTGPAASDDLVVRTVTFDKTFADPVAAGNTVVLTFDITNLDSVNAVSGLSFSDDLSSLFAGLTATVLPAAGFCGPSSTISGTTFLAVSNASLLAGGMCSFNVTLSIPANAAGGSFANITSSLFSSGLSVAAPASDTLDVVTQADLVITKTDSVDPVTAGNNLTYTVTVTNNGPSDAQNVVVTDTLPAGVTLVSTAGCAEDPAGAPTCTLGTIPAGGMAQYTLTVTVNPSTTGTLLNMASVSSSTTEGSPGNESTSEMTTVATAADLGITKTDSVDPVIAGNNLTYTVTVTNNGPSDAQNVVVTDTLPAGVTLVSTAGCAEDPAGAPTCSLGTVPASGMAQYTLTVTVNPSTTGTLDNLATVSSSTTEDNPGDESTSEMTTVSTSADLVITKTDSPDPVTAGSNLVYTVAVDNNGPSNALNVVVTDTLPAGVTLVSTAGCAEDPGGIPTCTLGTVLAGGSAGYTITVTVLVDGTLVNGASVTSSTPEGNPGQESTSETTTAVPAGTTTTVTNLVTTYSDFDQTLNLSATVTDSLPVNDGTVTFRVLDGAIQIGATVVSPTVAAGSAAALYTLPGLTPPNTYTIEATYSGGVGFAGSMGFGTLTVDPVLPGDTDGDGVGDAIEDAAPNGGDANMDGIADRLQSDVTSLPSTDGPYLTLITQAGAPVPVPPSALTGGFSNLTQGLADRAVAGGGGCQHRNVMVVDRSALPPDQGQIAYAQVRSPLAFELECSLATATVLYFGIDDLSQATYRKFGPTLADPSDHWYTLPGAVFGTTTVAGATVATATIGLADGGQGDHDLTVDNRILDPGGAAMVVPFIPTLSQWALLLLAAILGGAGILVMRSRL